MSLFFDFIHQLMKNLPQFQNTLRYLVLYQFRDIVFDTIFGKGNDLKEDFIEQVKKTFLNYVNTYTKTSVFQTIKQITSAVIHESSMLAW